MCYHGEGLERKERNVKTKEMQEILRKKRIFNDYEITKKGHPYIYVRTKSGSMVPKSVVIVLKGYWFKNSAWYEHGQKFISYSDREDRAEKIKDAIAWAERNFDVKMVKSPFGPHAWVPEADLKEALETGWLKVVSSKLV